MNLPEGLVKLGVTRWLREGEAIPVAAPMEAARVICREKGAYTISVGGDGIPAEAAGKLLYAASSPVDYPAVGDWVQAECFDSGTFAVIHEILPRRSFLKRKKSGAQYTYQPVAANIDVAFIIQSLDDDYSPRRLERYLVMVSEGGVRPVVLLSKCDLLGEDETTEKREGLERVKDGVTVIPFSNVTRAGFDRVERELVPGETICLLGSSGVGKTSLLNALTGSEKFETRPVRKRDGKGRHTTTRRQLVHLPNGTMVVDTPGMRELGMVDADSGLSDTFSDVEALTGDCRYRDCAHGPEKGCAVREALEAGTLSPKRYEGYMKILKESSWFSLSRVEKREKDRKFGKRIKSVMKEKKTGGRQEGK